MSNTAIHPIVQPVWGILLVIAVMTMLTLSLRLYQRRRQPSAEWVRKLLHMGGGITALSFPWLFNELWPVAVLAALLILQFAAMRFVARIRSSIGAVVCSVQRRSVGEFCFPLAVLLLYAFAQGDRTMYCAPLLCLTFADTAAALVGGRWGVLRFTIGGDTKSVEGSCAFLTVSLICCVAAMSLLGPFSVAAAVTVACLVAPVLTVVEAVSGDGVDNLLIPLGGYMCLKAAPVPLLADIDILIAMIAIVSGPLLLWGLTRRIDHIQIGGTP